MASIPNVIVDQGVLLTVFYIFTYTTIISLLKASSAKLSRLANATRIGINELTSGIKLPIINASIADSSGG